jgi:hexosaminidase
MNNQKKARSFKWWVLSIGLIAGCASHPSEQSAAAALPMAGPVQIVPIPSHVTAAAGAFQMSAGTRVIFSDPAAERVAKYFAELAQRTNGLALSVSSGDSEHGDVVHFLLSANATAQSDEGYSLLVAPDGITVTARDERGLFYGAVSLWQLLSSDARIPAMTIDDEPRFAWRGLMLDTVRFYQSPRFVKLFIDWMALHKLNTFHWHLTDDQGWRLEIKKYPKLTSVGAWRVPAGPAAAQDIDLATGKPRVIGGFYTQDEVRDIVKYAAERHITIVPEIELPGHASAAVVA